MLKLSLLFAVFLVSTGAHATSWDDVVDRAFDAMQDDLSEHFAYTETRRNSDGVSIGRYDPRFAQELRWQLESVDGREPTSEETEKFLQQKKKMQRNESDDEGGDIEAIIAEGSLELLDETDAHWLFGFKPSTDSDEEAEFMRSVDGTLMIVKDGHYVSQITMQNSKPIKPGKGIKIQEFRTMMDFAPLQAGGPTVPRSVQTSIQGKAMLVIKINESEAVEYSDFDIVAE